MSTFSIVCGTRACNAKCPFCISKMTGACADEQPVEFDWGRFDKACRYVSRTEERPTQTALITGRGEPTLYPVHLGKIINRLEKSFACIELQTNAIKYKEIAWEEYRVYGLNTISISVASLDDAINNEVMGINNDFSAREAIKELSKLFTIRVSYQLTMKDGPYHRVDNQILKKGRCTDWFHDTIHQAKELGAKQITFRIVGQPTAPTKNKEAYDWVSEFGDTHDYVEMFDNMPDCRKLGTYHWGGMIYDINGMSVCVAKCLTEDPNTFEPRSWIFDGKHLRYSWQYEGALVF